ncbi:arsenate reductase [Bisgaardia hudsonensis]|uniref:Arsenate reductase n=1 Tax=Bisgaardia hudsonensis TaxID=109472 RepID=A0A4R2N251_9PAST|nr:arsenate reductase (glutaredoxin) [Bisgaardia hudsonensis]QLB12387.1 arsenate reductase (glutaredoxin) [Bisgaardia hudsonensis]TCP13913.1 arsenate reductase [Bisgaardia hudsonensis]
MEIIIYHNPKCSKSRATLALLEKNNIQPTIELYLQNPLSLEQLKELVKKLGISSAREMMRIKDELYTSLALDNPELNEDELLETIVKNPVLLERPIVVNGERACIGRPPENVLSIL